MHELDLCCSTICSLWQQDSDISPASIFHIIIHPINLEKALEKNSGISYKLIHKKKLKNIFLEYETYFQRLPLMYAWLNINFESEKIIFH